MATRGKQLGLAAATALAVSALLAEGLDGAPPEQGLGSVTGTVRMAGEPPPIRPTILPAENPCAEAAGRRLPQQEVVVGADGGLANVFIRLQGEGLAAAAAPPPEEKVVVEQIGCVYYPRVSGGRSGQTLKIVNRDNFLHNVRSVSEMGIDFNIGQAFADMEFDAELFAEQRMLRLDCNFHPWMYAFVGVSEHSWFAVTGEDGRFELAEVPSGTYALELWHERFGTLAREVTVEADGVAVADFEFDSGSS